ncbi:uncharacterized protein N7459_008414 [Penicillium hispanicum]|uniref:uncharacterized protein n=1 Tax=Penicillium hispanicum TaxID=1080232 RepID=UPI002541BF61|nr:uncharacterized protein N7459_008414 [Penicillium hispanicum]KAJ5573987.1 hypothetical protein N7459_008414 [Penicillium hispanicum]
MAGSRRAFSPDGSEDERPPKRTKTSKVLDMITALYWDLNAVSHFRKLVLDAPSEQEQTIYDSLCHETAKFIDYAVSDHLTNPDQTSKCILLVKELGWKLLSICGHAESFRRAYWQAKPSEWDELIELITRESRSIQVFARSRQLEWRGPLLVHAQHDIPDLRQALSPEINIAKEHPHHTVRYLDGHLERPRYGGKPQVHIDSHFYNTEKYEPLPNPLLRQTNWGLCDLCDASETCACRLASTAGDLVELIECPGKGIGVRALANFKKGEKLGEFLGEVVPLSAQEESLKEDSVYPLTQVAFARGDRMQDIALIAPAWQGNWTRYLNHSCSASTRFLAAVIGEQITTLIVATRDIAVFEEITPPLIESTIGDHFARIVAEHGDRIAVISKHQNDRASYAALDTRSNALARGLESIGVRKGERVGVMLGNSMEYAVATYALFKLGAILVPLNPSFNSTQVVAALSHLESSHLIISAESNLPRKDPRSNMPLLECLVDDLQTTNLTSTSVPSLKQIIMVDNSAGRVNTNSYKSVTPFSSIMSQLPADGAALPKQHLSPHDTVNIQFTSGTTAMPKAACLSHRSILNNGSQIGDRMLLTPQDIVCCPPPLFHCFGSILGYMATATHGSAIVLPTESFNAHAALQAVQEEKCTALYGVPTMFLEELSLIENGEVPGDGFQYLRTGIAAGSSIPAELMKKLHRVLNLTELTICYGMTETSPVSTMTTTDDPIEKRINTVGTLMPHVEAKVVNPESKSEILPIETCGELAVSGYLLMKEYWGDPERTAEVMLADDTGKVWMHTGDEASISRDGYVSITGRIKDLIIRGGENIHPLEIENCLLAHSGIADVSVVGVPDERYGEVVVAFVVAREQGSKSVTSEEIQQWVREKLSNHLVPKYVFFLGPSETFPKTASGKIQKFKLKEKAVKLLAEEVGTTESH